MKSGSHDAQIREEIRNLLRGDPAAVLCNRSKDSDLDRLATQTDLITILPLASAYIGPPGARVRRRVLRPWRFRRRQRSRVVLCQGPNGACVVKPRINETEVAIARRAAEFGIGPRVFETFENLIIEEYLPGKPLKRPWWFRYEPVELGRCAARLLAALHACNIFYVDCFATHLIPRADGSLTLIDFGRSIMLGRGVTDCETLEAWYCQTYGGDRFEFGLHPFECPDRPQFRDFLTQHDLAQMEEDLTRMTQPRLRPTLNAEFEVLDAFARTYRQLCADRVTDT